MVTSCFAILFSSPNFRTSHFPPFLFSPPTPFFFFLVFYSAKPGVFLFSPYGLILQPLCLLREGFHGTILKFASHILFFDSPLCQFLKRRIERLLMWCGMLLDFFFLIGRMLVELGSGFWITVANLCLE